MNRADLKKISQIRLNESKILLHKRQFSGSFYISGYIIECALKACIARKTKKGEFPDKDAVSQSYTHDLTQLVRVSGLEYNLDKEIKKNKNFEINWTTVKDWSEQSRYEFHNQNEAQDLLKAIVDSREGVLQWIKRYW